MTSNNVVNAWWLHKTHHHSSKCHARLMRKIPIHAHCSVTHGCLNCSGASLPRLSWKNRPINQYLTVTRLWTVLQCFRDITAFSVCDLEKSFSTDTFNIIVIQDFWSLSEQIFDNICYFLKYRSEKGFKHLKQPLRSLKIIYIIVPFDRPHDFLLLFSEHATFGGTLYT